jgi:hypothetical protein
MNILHRIFDPQRRLKPLPPPHKSARVYTFAESVLIHRNHATAVRQSRELHTK